MQRIKSKSLTNEVKDSIYKYIKSLDLSKDTKLPSEENMAQLIGVSRITVRSALNELASEGVIFRRQGKGTFANSEALQMKAQLNPVKLFTDIIESSGYKSSIKALGYEIVNADFNLSNLLKIKENEPLVAVKKIFYADENPCTYCVDYFPLSLLENENECDDLNRYDESIFKFLGDKAGVGISWDKVEIKTITNVENEELNSPFECSDKVKSFLLLEGINFDENDRPVMYIKEYIDTTFIRFNIIRQRLMG